MKIGELAKAAKCTTETIRFYEKKGLLPDAARTEGNYRTYGEVHVERLRFIRNCRALNMTHDEIRELLFFSDVPAENCCAVNALLDEHIVHVEVRIAELLHLKAQLTTLREQCRNEQGGDACGILRGLAEMETTAGNERHTHLG